MSVYFARAGDDGPVKIGKASDVMKRMAALQSGCPLNIEIIRIVDGGFSEELWFHKRFSSLRTHGEWFEFDERMLTDTPPEFVGYERPIKKTVNLPTNDEPDSEFMSARQIVNKIGGVRYAAAAFEVTEDAIRKWQQKNIIPAMHHAKVRKLAHIAYKHLDAMISNK